MLEMGDVRLTAAGHCVARAYIDFDQQNDKWRGCRSLERLGLRQVLYSVDI